VLPMTTTATTRSSHSVMVPKEKCHKNTMKKGYDVHAIISLKVNTRPLCLQ
jgi:hypothetical protein